MGEKNINITNEELARMIKMGFDDVHEEFCHVHSKLDNVENELKEVKGKLEGVIYRFEYNELQNRLEAVERQLGIRK
jgi:hypothetical protein